MPPIMDGWPKILWQAASILLCLLSIGSALPTHDHHQDYRPIGLTHPFAEFVKAGSKRADKSLELRILSLGASIMSGTGSSNGNGCRKFLRDALRLDGWPVNMVGSLKKGTMKDKDHEAVPGDVLTQVLARVPNSTGFKPNIVIINAGTNDANTPVDPANAGSRLNDILNALWKADGMSKTCLIVSTLIPTTNTNGAANQGTINDQYRALWFDFSKDYLAGETPAVHPNDGDHAKMAAVYYNAINQALDDNRVVEPGEFTTGSSVCPKYGGEGKDAGGLTQRGSGYSDGIYYHDSVESGVLFTADSDWDRGQWKFARLFDRRYDDLVAWINKTSTSQVYATIRANSGDGKGKFTQVSDLNPDLNCQYTDGVKFIDMNAGGLDDLVYIDADGNAYLSINQGDGNRAAGKPPTFKRVSSTALIKKTEGKKRDHVVLADIDGDGRGDYGVLDDAGNAFFWRNGRIDDIPKYWQYLGKRFEGKNKGDLRGTQFEDINGDGCDDWMEMWANRGKGTITESDPDGYWNYKGTIWTPPQEMDRRDLHLADWDGDGACDIIYANPKGGAVQVWINNYPKTGKWDWTHQDNPAPALSCSQTRGLGLYDLAVRFADITGNGRADYLCIEPGSGTTGFIHNDDGSWTNAGQVKVSIDKDRANLRWADVNGDGRDDLLWVEKFSGDAYVYYNHGPSNPDTTLGSSFAWAKQDSVAYAGNAQGSCEFWADIDGNGRADEHFILGSFNNKARTALAPSFPGAGTGGGSGGGGNNGGGSGDGDGLVLVPPLVWADPHPTVGCVPPCTLIWPPLPIAPTTISWPPVTTSIWSVVGGVTRTVTTVITVNPFVISKVPFWPVVVGSGDPTNGVLKPVQSVIPPLVTVPLSSDQASIKTTTSDDTTTILPPVWAPGRHTGSFQPMPTVSVTLPPGPVTNPITTTTAGYHTVSYTRTHPTTTCTADCGSRDCGLFGCIGGGTSCGLFGCLGGCGLFGCDGLCGVSECTPNIGGGGGGGGNRGDPEECQRDDCGCDDSKKVTSCGVLCTHTVDQTTTRTGECSTTTCITTSCGTDTTRTSTTTTTEEDDVAITEVARDTFWSEDASADFASTVYNDFMSWWSVEESAAAAIATVIVVPSATEIVIEIETAVVTVRPTATKTVTKETSKKTTTTKEASAPKPSLQVQIVHTLFITKCFGEPGCSNKRTYNWLVYATDYGEGVNFCRDQDSIYAASTNDFDLKNCKYTAKSATEVGTMVCDGLASIKCEPANDAGKIIIITAALIRGAISTPSVVQFWAYSSDCNGGQGGAATVAYIPDCSGACYVYEDFYSVMLYTGGGLPGFGDAIDCAFYADNNCQMSFLAMPMTGAPAWDSVTTLAVARGKV
ncbi:hypothetical protein NM208_g1190 [Fusarium decemcellulare]|uniref:Uncharacterized protein n=1 Tax=Fusarium decemcellulare TaxID=57161 RepID=A0ACC1SX38_9HYPO|nr:hypothetical protein NM208_g1190 [Fusarium decemcellulare]